MVWSELRSLPPVVVTSAAWSRATELVQFAIPEESHLPMMQPGVTSAPASLF
jgi:hypothetical protein